MAQTKAKSQNLNPTTSTDANGWTVTDFGSRKLYTRKYSWTGSQAMPADSNYSLPSIALPVGVSTRAGMFMTFEARCNDRTYIVNERVNEAATTVSLEVSEWHSASITLTNVWVDLIAWSV